MREKQQSQRLAVHYGCVVRSVVEIWQYMSQFTGEKLLVGDLNAEPYSTPIRYIYLKAGIICATLI